MPTPTKAPPQPKPLPATERPALALPLILALGAAYAAAELAAGILIGNFFAWGRAEALLFYALRPWLLLAAALLLVRWPVRDRLLAGGAGLLLASAAETLLLVGLEAASPWPEAVRGLLAGALLFLLIDAAIQLGRRFLGPWGRAAAAAAVLLLFLVPNGLRPYEALATSEWRVREVAEKRDLMLMTALPLVWGEQEPLDPDSRPAASFKMLEQEFAVRPLDVLDDRSLGSGRLLLLAQPRALAPTELARLDEWVRKGGRALVLTDPLLLWPSELPLGDIRRPPALGLLGPILTHWGLSLSPPPDSRAVVRTFEAGESRRRLILFAPGALQSNSPQCSVSNEGLIADCRLGKGRAVVLADADLLHDRLWVSEVADGTARGTRISDNPLVVADLLDTLSGAPRARLAGDVEWLDPAADRRLAILLALLPLAAAATPALVRGLRRRG